MMSEAVSLRCGLIGVGPALGHWQEALSTHAQTRLSWSWDVSADEISLSIALEQRLRADPVDVVVLALAGPQQVAWASKVLRHSVSVWLPEYVAGDVEPLQRLFELAAQQGCACEVGQPPVFDAQFQQAAKLHRERRFGNLLRVDFTLCQLSPWLLPADVRQDGRTRLSLQPPAEATYGTLATFGWRACCQLLELVAADVIRITGRCWSDRLQFGTRSGSQFDPGQDTACEIGLDFSTGVTARLFVNLASTLVSGPAWNLQGTLGSYSAGRQVILVEDGELYDVPVETPSLDLIGTAVSRLSSATGDAVVRRTRCLQATEIVTGIRRAVEVAHDAGAGS